MATFKKRSLLILSLFFLSLLTVLPITPMAEAVPGTVETNTPVYAASFSYQRKGFYAAGRFWAFYSDGVNGIYESTTDPSVWSGSKTSIGDCVSGNDLSIFFDGTYVHYTCFRPYYVYYRRGTPNVDGTITWSKAEQEVVTGTSDNHYDYPSLTIDSNGYAWIGLRYNHHQYYPYVLKNSKNDGTWVTDFSYQLSATTDSNWLVQPVPLTVGKVYVVYCHGPSDLPCGKLYNAGWGSEETDLADYNINGFTRFCAVPNGDDVYFVYNRATTYQIRYNKRTYGAGWAASDVLVQDSMEERSDPSLSIDLDSGDLYCFWSKTTTDHIYYKRCVGGTWDTDPTDWIDETIDGIPYADLLSSYYQTYSNFTGLLYVTGLTPYNLKFSYLGPPPNNVNVTITNMNADNWVFAEYKYYTFEAIFNCSIGWNKIDSIRVWFSDGGGLIDIQYNVSTGVYTVPSGDDKIVLRIISAYNASAYEYDLTFGVYFTKNVIDSYDIDIYAGFNCTTGASFSEEVANEYFNIYNLGGRTEYRELGDTSLSNHPVRSDPFDLQVTGGAGGDIAVNVTYRNLQQVSLLAHLIIPTNRIDDQYAGEWSAEYGIYYYANGSWTKGWNVKLEFSNGYVSNKDYWIYVHARWYRNNGVLVGSSEYFSSFFRPGLVNGTTVWVDLWFSNTNSSTAGAGRVSAEYYGMKNNAPWFAFWYSDWGPMLANQTMSYYEMPLLDWEGDVISTKDVELIKVYSRLYKTSSSGSYTVEIKSPEVFDRKIARGDFVGIPTPPFVPPKVMDMPQGGLFGLLQTFLASIVAAITQALSPAFATCVAILDGIFAWAGWPGGFTQITTWISQMAGFMISAMGWMMTMLTGLFGFFTVTVPAMLYVVTSALTIYIDMIGKFWGFFTGLFGTGFDIWNDFGGTQWVTIGIMIYPMYLLLLWTEHGLAPVMVHLDFWGGLIMGLVNIAISLAGLVWSFISGLIENIPVVE